MKFIDEKLNSFFTPKVPKKVFNAERYVIDIMQGKFKNKVNLGVCEIDGMSWLLKDFEKEPNALYVGVMGSGKSESCKFSLITWLLSNNDITTMFLVDVKKGAQDYGIIHSLNNVYLADSEVALFKVIDLLYDEYNEREKLFKTVGANSVSAYEALTNSKMDRVLTMMEEFHAIPNVILEYESNFQKKGTPANKFHELMRLGRSHGIWFFGCSQKSTKSDVPSQMQGNFTQKMMFKVSKAEANYMINTDAPAKILSDQKGRCFNELGEVQFPYLQDKDIQILMDYFIPKNTHVGKCAYLTHGIISQYLAGKTTKEFYRFKKFTELANIFKNRDAQLIISIFFEAMGNTVEETELDYDPNNISHIVTWGEDNPKAGSRCAIMIKPDKDKVTGKHVDKMIKGIIEHKCHRGIIISGGTTPSVTVHKVANTNKIEIMDFEDLSDQAKRIDYQRAKKIKIQFSPDELAGDSKESGEYQKLNNEMEDTESDDNEVPIIDEVKFEENDEVTSFIQVIENNPDVIAYKKSLEDKVKKEVINDPEEVFVSTKGIKRPQLNKLFKLNSTDNPSLIVSCLKTEENEIFRVLMSVMKNKKVIHTYAIDKKINSKFSYEHMLKLGIDNIKEWNADSFTYNEEIFINELNSFLDNFNSCENTVPIICWNDDKEFIEEFICDHHIIKDEATIIEEIAEAQYQVKQTKKELRLLVGTNSDEFYGEILQDADLWNQL